ncbi:hypothetical protein VIBHAR_04742 [Vibrio campbellii ATCC BAA-1116]|uniref:Uncharacterized protein n=1 Tax=Vibrio campbellii (strain ATCC BAA-1116) TaxID=2902295 RepID=A7N3I3_VIBC1|nr:hypothetical protein VIBHAR_04742 [Vibrio campbellii ATCC BAA-1116]
MNNSPFVFITGQNRCRDKINSDRQCGLLFKTVVEA